MAVAVAGLVEDDAAFSRAAAGDNGHGASLAQLTTERVGVITLVGQDISGAGGALQQRGGDGDVGDVARRQREGEGSADGIGEGVDFGRLAAARGPDRLRAAPPFPPNAERWALM